ncbi:MAG: FAD-dependent monooxygenase [Porticoccaceae bacterium]
MRQTETSDVVVIGAGPVGLSLAIDLGMRGIATTIVELNDAPLRLPKMERTNPRTMEIYRRLGVHEQIRGSGLKPDKPMDVYIVEHLGKPPLLRLPYPSVNETRAAIAQCTNGTLPREPYQLISQYTLEPILEQRLRDLPSVTLCRGTEFLSLSQDEDGVSVQVRDHHRDAERHIRCRYLVGADGGSSRVRKAIEVEMEGQAGLGVVTNIFFRCDDLLEKSVVPQARHYCFAPIGASGGAAGTMAVQDDQKHFALHTTVPPDGDIAEVIRNVLGLDINPEVIHSGPWTQHMLVAKQHSLGRVFLAGDANHLFIPAGGLGMNTGIGDAINLGWKLEAALKGWGGEKLLESYSAERNATARRTLKKVAHAVEGSIKWREAFTPCVLEDTSRGRAEREVFLEVANPLIRRIYEMHGSDLGYRYQSPVICGEAEEPPPDDAYTFVPSTYPGCHLPHAWLDKDTAVYDAIGPGFALLKLGTVDSAALEKAFADSAVPLKVLEIADSAIRKLYGRDLILVRPDLHVAWRGNAAPENPLDMVRTVTGR